MFLTSKSAAGSPFTHIASVLNFKAKKAEEDEDKKEARAEDDEESKKAKKAEGDKDDADSDEEKKKDAKADSDGDNDDEKPEPRSKKKSKKAEDDGDQEKDDEPNARAAERARIRAVIDSPEAGTSPDALELALDLALNTDEPASICLVNLRAFNRAMQKAESAAKTVAQRDTGKAREDLSKRMAETPKPDLGAGSGEGGQQLSLAQQIVLAGKKRRGEI